MDPNQFQMGKSKLFIKDPASVRFSSKGAFGPTGAVFSNYESEYVKI